MRTKGKAGYFVWKSAGGQGDQDINLTWFLFGGACFFDFWDIELFVANPLLILINKSNTNNNVTKER